MTKQILLGNQAIARGAYEAGVKVATAYPGTPSTEITENVAKYDEIYAEWAPNEKVAYEVAAGASVSGKRTLVCMKHVGVNVAADPMFTFSYTGVNGGFVMVAADDPAMYSSQNEQDSRYYALAAHMAMLEPSDSQEAKDFVKFGYELSEKFDTPVVIRTTTRLAHSQSEVELCDRVEQPDRPYVKDPQKYIMMPGNAIKRHIAVEQRENALKQYANECPLNKIEYNGKELGVICSGIVYQYVKEALPNASVFKLGMVNPLPMDKIKEFASKVEKLVVIEELEPIFETQIKAAGIPCHGKDLFSVQGEITVPEIKEKLFGVKKNVPDATLPGRPPVMCAGCPHRGVYYVLKKLGLTVCADIGCYTLGAVKPLNAVDTVLCMGASIGMAHGFIKGGYDRKKVVSVIGDSTFIHSGITGVIDAVYNQSASTIVIVDNSTTGMTGHQDHPATGKTVKGTPAPILDLEKLLKACGVGSVRCVDSYDLAAVEKAVKEALEEDFVSVVVTHRPCQLLKTTPVNKALKVDGCRKCGMCMKIGCPAISKKPDGTVTIAASQCVGCGVCAQLCHFGAIKREEI